MRSPQLTSTIEPTEKKPLNPTRSRILQSRTELQRAPLWLMKARSPSFAKRGAKVAFSLKSRDHYPKTIRTDDSHLTSTSHDRFFELRTQGSALLKACRDDHRTRYPGLGTL